MTMKFEDKYEVVVGDKIRSQIRLRRESKTLKGGISLDCDQRRIKRLANLAAAKGLESPRGLEPRTHKIDRHNIKYYSRIQKINASKKLVTKTVNSSNFL